MREPLFECTECLLGAIEMAEAIRVVEAFAGEPLSWFEAPQAPDAGL